MSVYFSYIILVVIAYLLGSIPSSVWIGKGFFKIDVREHGSKNAGATNTFRVLGPKAGTIVFILDALKGFAAAQLIVWSQIPVTNPDIIVGMQVGLGLGAFLGHVFPIFAGFRGGKGVATLFGVILGIHPWAALIAFGIFLVVFLISKYVSLGSLTAGVSFPLLLIFVFDSTPVSLTIFSILVAVLIVLTHQKNIGRLVRNEEKRIELRPRKNRFL